MPQPAKSLNRWPGPGLGLFALGSLHALCSVAFFAPAFEHPPGNALVYWPGVGLVASAWGLWWRTWWARRGAAVGCAIVLASPLLLGGVITVGPYGGGLALYLVAGYLLAAVPSAYGLWWLTRTTNAALFHESRPGFHWTTPLKVLAIVVVLAVGAGLHAARPIEAYFTELVIGKDRELADLLVRDLIAAVRSGDERHVASAEEAIGEIRSGGRVVQAFSEMFSIPSYPNPELARTIADALRRYDGPENAELRRALLRALQRCRSGWSSYVQQTVLGLVDDEDAEVRRLAVSRLPRSEQAVQPLLRRMQDAGEDPTTRADAAKTLKEIARNPGLRHLAPDIMAGLHEASRTDDAQAKAAAIEAIAAIDPGELALTVREGALSVDEAIPYLVAALRGPDGDHRLRAAEALAELGPSARAALPQLEAALAKATFEWEKTALRATIDAIQGSQTDAPDN
jgi:HEAT repeat protein